MNILFTQVLKQYNNDNELLPFLYIYHPCEKLMLFEFDVFVTTFDI